MNKAKITLKEIEEIKLQAENYIRDIIRQTESKTGCRCQSVDMYIKNDETNEELQVDLNLRITHRLDLEE